jgi:hypothetical protein
MTKEININKLISEINSYNLSLHKLTYRYGIDYIKFTTKFKEKYPEIVEELSDYYVPRKVTIIMVTSSDGDNTIECGNKYEINTLIGIPKCDRVVLDGEEYIENLKWWLLSDCDEHEIKEYKDRLTLKINVYGEYINKIDYLKFEIMKNSHKSNIYPYIIKGVAFGYNLIDKPIELNIHKFPFSDLYYCKDPLKDDILGDNNYTNIGMSLSYILEDILINSEYKYSYYDINGVMDWFEDYLKNNHEFIDKKVLFGNQIKGINE